MPMGGFIDLPLSIPRIGLGMAALGRPGYINLGHGQSIRGSKSKDEMRANCHQVMDAAYDLGIRYFDAARSYGLAESFVSSWLQERKLVRARKGSATDQNIMLGSKWGYYYTADWAIDTGGKPHEVKDHEVANLVKQTEESDALLGSNLGLYQIHSATLESGVLEDQEVLLDFSLGMVRHTM